MDYRLFQKESLQALWCKRVAFFSLQLLVLTVILHRFATLQTQTALNLFLLGLAGGVIALLLAVGGLVRIWRHGFLGAGAAFAGLLVCAIIFAYPAWLLPQYLSLPEINDVSTDPLSPPSFESLGEQRIKGSNSIIYPGEDFSREQFDAYPDIRPIVLERSNVEAFELVQEAVQRLKWKIVSQNAPGENGEPGRMEAIDKTLLMGFEDDIAIRVTGTEASAKIDVRSASRFGRHDFGRNANRIRLLMAEIKEGLAKGEPAPAKKVVTPKKRKNARKVRHRKRRYRARSRARDARARRAKQRSRRRQSDPNTFFQQFD